MFKILFLIFFLIHYIYTFWKLKKNLHILQLNSYVNKYYLTWIYKNISKTILLKDFLPFFALIPIFFNKIIISSLILVLSYLYLFYVRSKKIEKKKLVFTNRAKRLFLTVFILFFILYLFAFRIVFNVTPIYFIIILTSLIFLNVFCFIILIIANLIIIPLEKIVQYWYYKDAQKFIDQMPSLTVIGITGSFGKTSTKYILYKILSEKFNVLMSPESYNTTMGITKTIRMNLKAIHEIFIVEMGAKQKGDIAELCKLVSPKIGVLTAIKEQHLETFKSIENIKQTKNELIESLPTNGIAFFNTDDVLCKELYLSAKVRKINYGIKSDISNYSARDIKFSSKGSSFTVSKYDGITINFQTKLLGEHNIYNILAAVAVAGELGVDIKILPPVIKNIEPVPHRLELKQTAQNIIIDDSFNSNPIGSQMALAVLKEITGNKKILVTPGMIELGEKEYEFNKNFGINAADVCDYIILVGPKRTIPIVDGLKSKNYSDNKYCIVMDIKDAQQHLQKIMQPLDVVLFENDLPDTYDE